MLGGDLLDLHAAFGRGDNREAAGGAVEKHGEIELAPDIAAFFNIEPFDFLAGWAGLLGDQHVAQHVARVLADLFDRLADAHAALAVGVVGEAPGAAAASVDLGFHHIDGTAQLAGDVLCFFRRVSDAALRSRNAVFGEERLRLIFVNVHEASKISLFRREERRLGQARR